MAIKPEICNIDGYIVCSDGVVYSNAEKSVWLKFYDNEQYLDELMSGKLYCNSVNYFRHNNNYLQGDCSEGTMGKISMNGDENHIFCLYNLPPYMQDKGTGDFKLTPYAIEHFKVFFAQQSLHKVGGIVIYDTPIEGIAVKSSKIF